MGKAARRKQRIDHADGTPPVSSQNGASAVDRRYVYLICALLILATLAVYWQVTKFDFCGLDDNPYVIDNTDVRAGLTPASVRWAFNIGYTGNWHPLTWLSHMADVEVYGLGSDKGLGVGGHHLTSAILHILNTLLLFLLLTRMTGALWRAGFVAAIFALHPLHVESVAWISERKDVLSAFFWLLTMLAYAWYAGSPKLGRYLVVLGLFVLGLMAKPMLVTLPLVLLMMDYWPLRRFGKGFDWKFVYEKIPFFALVAVSSYITYRAQERGEMVSSLDVLPLGQRLANALMTYVVYLAKAVWPQKLAAYYPHPGATWPVWQVVGSAVLLACVTYLAIRAARNRPYITVGWLWYLITLVPVVGVVQVGLQARADRYTYIPLIGVLVIVAWAIPDLLLPKAARKSDAPRLGALVASAVLVIIALTAVTYRQIGYWRDGEALFRRAAAVTERNWFAENALGGILLKKGEPEEAVERLQRAIEIQPGYAGNYLNMGMAMDRMGRLDEAISNYRECLRLHPNDEYGHNNLANCLFKKRDLAGAVEQYHEALRINPKYPTGHYNLATVLIQLGKRDEAIAEYREALRLNPTDYWANNDLALQLAETGHYDEAFELFEQAQRIDPNNRAAFVNMDLYKKRMRGE